MFASVQWYRRFQANALVPTAKKGAILEVASAHIPFKNRPADTGIDKTIACMKVKDAIKLVEADGRRIARIRGSHRHYHHAPN
jgi:hypothetical protein